MDDLIGFAAILGRLEMEHRSIDREDLLSVNGYGSNDLRQQVKTVWAMPAVECV
jgi:hypothetical protein